MFMFALLVVVAFAFLVVAPPLINTVVSKDQPQARLGRIAARTVGVVMVLGVLLAYSIVWPNSGEIVIAKRTMLGKPLPPGKIVATDGEMGPQARIYTAGFHFAMFTRLVNDFETHPVFTVPPGKCAIMSARDGAYVNNGAAFADPWSTDKVAKMANDAEYFLANGGQRGPQATVLGPGSYTINPYLWETPRLIDAIRIDQGYVGVVKSSVHAAVDFGSFQRQKPENPSPVKLKDRIPLGSAAVNIVAVGAVGVWEEPLLPQLYYINTDAYKVTMVPVSAMVFSYKGGYDRRSIDVTIDDKTGSISVKEREKVAQSVPEGADEAVFVKPEGWDVAQELRVLAQISPDDAPLVVAGLGLTDTNAVNTIDERVVTPVIRSVVRDVMGGKSIRITTQEPVTDEQGTVKLDEKGEPIVRPRVVFRPVRVLDLLENRASLEEAILDLAKHQAEREFIRVLEVRLAESAIPPELLVARKRQQLAEQVEKAFEQEKQAQIARQLLEKERATAEQQGTLVKADIELQAAKLNAQATKTKAEGDRDALVALAEGQEKQKQVLGERATLSLRQLELLLQFAQSNPDIVRTALSNPQKWVPTVVVNGGERGAGFEGAAAVFGQFIGSASDKGASADESPTKSDTVTK